MKNLLLLLIFFLLVREAKSQQCLDPVIYNGTATFFNNDGTGYCGIPIKTDSMYIVALNTEMYNASKACGSCMEISAGLGKVVVSVQDVCPDCPAGRIDLSRLAYSKIASLDSGVINVTWKSVPCPVTGGIKYFFSAGSNPYFIDLQIRNSRYAIEKVEFKNNGSNFTEMQRQNYNSFTLTPPVTPAASPFEIRVTDILGNVITESVPFVTGTELAGNYQFPLCQVTASNDIAGKNNPLNIYPNPAHSMVTIDFEKFEINAETILQLYDINNKLIKTMRLNENKTLITVGDLSSGIYFVKVISEHGVWVKKLFRE